MKKTRRAKPKKLFMIACLANSILSLPVVCYASADEIANSVTEPMNQVISVVLSVLAVVGVFMLIKSLSDLSNSMQDSDTTGTYRAGRGIGASVLLMSLRLIIGFFGYKF